MADGENTYTGPPVVQPRQVTRRDVRLASDGLVYLSPSMSCATKVRQTSAPIIVATLVGVAGLFQPALVLTGLAIAATCLFVLLITMRATLLIVGLAVHWKRRRSQSVSVSDEGLPRYSVLVPLYKEFACVPGLVRSLRALDYPADRLEVLFLTEEDDIQTRAALTAEFLPEGWSVLVLPDGLPRTKPRALNVALEYLTGSFLTIYDAEDHPHPGQLKAAIAAFRAGGEHLGCVQAPLCAHNDRVNWLAGHWALEYAGQFGLILPALAALGLPIALGGTSNHFRVDAVKQVGGWDAWNVTEDADLGLRMARFGYRVGTITPLTLEEAPEQLSVWAPQRSRWIKGYMQSWSVIVRQPFKAMREMGVRPFMASQLMLGGAVLTAFVYGPLTVFCLFGLLMPELGLAPYSIALLIAGAMVACLGGLLAPGRKDLRRWWLALSSPLYMSLHCIAATRALYGLATAPHLWSKTPHALTASDPAANQQRAA